MEMNLDDFAALDEEVTREIDESVEFARNSPEPEFEEWEDVVFAS